MSAFMIVLDRIPAFVIYIALFATATGLFGHFWVVIHENPILFSPPYSPYLKAGTDGPFILSIINLAWLLLTVVPQECGWKCTRAWWALVTLLRAANIAALSVFAFCQAQYLPRPLESCSREHRWPERSGVSNEIPTMWDLLPTYIAVEGGGSGGYKRRLSPCETLVKMRKYEFALIGILAFSMIWSSIIFVRFPIIGPDISRPKPWVLRLNRGMAAPFRGTASIYSGLKQRSGKGNSEAEMQPLSPDTEQPPGHMHSGFRFEGEDGIRVKPMPDPS